MDINTVLNKFSNKPAQFQSISKFPEVIRDLSILIDSEIKFENIYKVSKQINQKLIKEITLFDVYEGKNLPKNKKATEYLSKCKTMKKHYLKLKLNQL